uniref:Uncharacterized protein TCIL3000_11_11760 n=1 Tax=Trypanosoma congolense (strain IL3000) TaxID=1068625 RepID=G0V212_TRYCI|nr:unnamed protein product [Trypanosoma congolense IL3000]
MTQQESKGLIMTEELVVRQCKRHQGYTTPELNKNLYLNHLGFTAISSLGAFHQCRVLYLNNNAIENLEGLSPLQNLHSLYISSNLVQNCHTLPWLPSLHLLDISSNYLENFEGLSNAPKLETLLASQNRIKNLRGLETTKGLQTIDLSKNSIENEDDVLPWILPLKTLRSCMFGGNRFAAALQNYRKRMISWIPSLRSIDHHPVFPEERSCAEAYAKGGPEAEEEQRMKNKHQKEEERQRQYAFFSSHREKARQSAVDNGPTRVNTAYFDGNDFGAIFVPKQNRSI